MVVACLGFTAEAVAEHARPKAATPAIVRFVPAFEECFGSDMFHGAPLAIPSCSAPIQSTYLTLVAPERVPPFQATANGTAALTLKTGCLTPGMTTDTGEASPCPAAGDQIDIKMSFNATDVRCVGVAGQGNCAGGAASLYNGKLLIDLPIRITDHYNAIVPNPTGTDCSDTSTCAATADFPVIPVGLQCASGSCNYVTSVDVSVPGATVEGKRAVYGLGAIEVQDAGLNGNLAAAPSPSSGVCPPACQADGDSNTVFLTQGFFVP